MKTLGRIGCMRVQLAQSREDLDAVQRLRYRVFADEFQSDGTLHADGRDMDRFDPFCDHLLVIDDSLEAADADRVVGTYRLMRHDIALTHGFYSSEAFSIDDLVLKHQGRRFLELGRSCVLPKYRSRRTIELLWQGIWAYCREYSIDVMVGSASFVGTVPAQHALPLSFLHHFANLKGDWHVDAIDENAFSLDMMPAEAINMKQALLAMPPLIKGYLRVGGLIGTGGVIDREFGSIDVFIGLPVENISKRYINHYGENADRFAA